MMPEQTRISCPTLLVKTEMGDGLGLESGHELNRTAEQLLNRPVRMRLRH